MSARITDAEVKEILDTDISDTTPFITAANLIVTNTLGSESMSTSLLKEIERWLTAHLASMRDQRIKSERFGDAEATYQGITGMGLDFSSYGQQVKLLDTSGKLALIGYRPAEIKAIM